MFVWCVCFDSQEIRDHAAAACPRFTSDMAPTTLPPPPCMTAEFHEMLSAEYFRSGLLAASAMNAKMRIGDSAVFTT